MRRPRKKKPPGAGIVRRLLPWAVLAVILILAVLLVSFADRTHDETKYVCKDCNVILITIDTLRWDHVGYYGYERNTTPVIDKLASEGVLFSKNFVAASYTPASLSSILTSQYISDHGLATFVRGHLKDEKVSIAEVLTENGYQTSLVTFFKFDLYNMNQGFQSYYRHEKDKANALNELALRWSKKKPEGKFFLWIHYFDPHRAYRPPTPFNTLFNSEYDIENDPQFTLPQFFENIWAGVYSVSDEDIGTIVSQYDGEIAFTDQQIGLLLGNLSEQGLLNNTLVIITADHGETFDEHPETKSDKYKDKFNNYMFCHDPILYDEVSRVPLIFWGPGLPKGVVVEDLVESIDITPTILSLLEIDYNKTMMYGQDLSIMFDGNVPAPKQYVYSEIESWEYMKMVRSDRYKYIRNLRNENADEFYDLLLDPGEKNNIVNTSDQELVQQFRLLMDSFIARHRQENKTKGDKAKNGKDELNSTAEKEKQLRDLGYIY